MLLQLDSDRFFTSNLKNALKFAVIFHGGLGIIFYSLAKPVTQKIYQAQTQVPFQIVSIDRGDAEFPKPYDQELPDAALAKSTSLQPKTQQQGLHPSPEKKLNALPVKTSPAGKTPYPMAIVLKKKNWKSLSADSQSMAGQLPEKRNLDLREEIVSVRGYSGYSSDSDTEAGDPWTLKDLAGIKDRLDAHELYEKRLRELQQNGG